MARKKPTGGKALDEFARKIVQVPKTEVDRLLKREQQRKKRGRKK